MSDTKRDATGSAATTLVARMRRSLRSGFKKASTRSDDQSKGPTCRFLFVNNLSENAKKTQELLKIFRENSNRSDTTSKHISPLHVVVGNPPDCNIPRRHLRSRIRKLLLLKQIKRQLKPSSRSGKLFLVVQAEAFVIYVNLLVEKNEHQLIREAVQGIVILCPDANVQRDLIDAFDNLEHRFNFNAPLTWIHAVKPNAYSTELLLKDVLQLEQLAQENQYRSSNDCTNFQLLNRSAKTSRESPWENPPRDSSSRGVPLGLTRSFSVLGNSFDSASRTASPAFLDSLVRQGEHRVQPLLQQAASYHTQGRLRDAELCYGEVLRLDPPLLTQLSTKSSLATIHLQQGKHLEAERELDLLINTQSLVNSYQQGRFSTLFQDLMLRRAVARARLGRYQEVFQDLKDLATRSGLWIVEASKYIETGTSLKINIPALERASRWHPAATSLDVSIARLWALSAAYSGSSPEICSRMLKASGSILSLLENQQEEEELRAMSAKKLEPIHSQDACGQDPEKRDLVMKHFGAIDNKTGDLKTGDLKLSQDFRRLRIAIDLTGAKIQLLQGNLLEARLIIDKAWEEVGDRFLDFNVLTLEVALVRAHILTITHHFTEARYVCSHIAALTSTHLGEDHPFVMDADWVLILAASIQGRYAESMIMSKSLCERAESNKNMGLKHPLTLKYKSQQAEIRLRLGHHRDAEGLLVHLVADAKSLWPSDNLRPNPCTLRYLSQLALAECFLEKIKAAEHRILKVLQHQPWPSTPLNEEYSTKLSCHFTWAMTPSMDVSKCSHSHEKVWLDPDTMISILIRGWVEVSKQFPDMAVIMEILEIGRKAVKPPGLPPASDTRICWGLALGQVYSGRAMIAESKLLKRHYSLKAIDELVYTIQEQPLSKEIMKKPLSQGPPERLPENHPMLMAARRDLHTIRSFAFSMKPENPENVKRSLEKILKVQETNPGWAHPDTLQTMMCLLANDVATSTDLHDETVEMLKDLQIRLDTDLMRVQCPLQRHRLLENAAELVRCRDDFVKNQEVEDILAGMDAAIAGGFELTTLKHDEIHCPECSEQMAEFLGTGDLVGYSLASTR